MEVGTAGVFESVPGVSGSGEEAMDGALRKNEVYCY